MKHHLARQLSISLAHAADRLDGARSAGEFIAAIADNRRIWSRLRSAAHAGYIDVSPQFLAFSLKASVGDGGRLDDHHVEALIHINRLTSTVLLRAVGVAESHGPSGRNERAVQNSGWACPV